MAAQPYDPSKPGYPAAQPGYPAAQTGYPAAPPPAYAAPAGQTTVIYQQPQAPVLTVQTFREVPIRMKCPKCQADIITSTTYEVGSITWVACLVIAFIGFWLGCCLIPFCLDATKDVVHTCPNCRMQIGRYNRM